MKLILEKVKIYGFDPAIFRTFNNDGKETKQYSVGLYISQEQRELIDSYIYGKCETTKDGEILFYGKSKQPIPVFDPEKVRIEKPINEVFLADVSILIDEFTDSKTDMQVRYSKCLGIKYVCPIANEAPRIFTQEKFETFDEIFGGENETTKAPDFSAMKNPEEIGAQNAVTPSSQETFEPTIPPIDDLPF